jgi:hypothetical protein
MEKEEGGGQKFSPGQEKTRSKYPPPPMPAAVMSLLLRRPAAQAAPLLASARCGVCSWATGRAVGVGRLRERPPGQRPLHKISESRDSRWRGAQPSAVHDECGSRPPRAGPRPRDDPHGPGRCAPRPRTVAWWGRGEPTPMTCFHCLLTPPPPHPMVVRESSRGS